jgi:predicted MFS family arabinose efflux permease
VGGGLVQAAGGPAAVLVDAATFVCSAACLASIRKPERARAAVRDRRLLNEIAEGLRAVWHSRVLRALTATDATSRFFGGFYQALYGLFLIRTLGFSPLAVGLTIGAGGIGSLFGAFLAGPMTRRLGHGWTLIVSKLVPVGVLIPLAGGPPQVAFAMIFVAQLFGDPFWSTYEITATSVRQSITPERLLGRVNASAHVVQAGLLPLGALAAGLLAGPIGTRETLWLAQTGLLASALWLIASPVRQMRELPRNEPSVADAAV